MTNTEKLPKIPDYFSIYLDLARLSAALFVLFFHIKKHSLGPQSILHFIPDRGHDFVILFFVLSGYVISYTADQKKHLGLTDFAIDRATRIFSVSIPALLISLLLSLFYSTAANELPTLLINLVFLGQIGFKQFVPFWNQPYWSLCYEVMYYIGFAIVFFLENSFKKYLLLCLFLLVAGPKVLLLMPCWLLGCLIYQMRDKFVFKPLIALFLALLIPVIASVVLHVLHYGDFVRGLLPTLFGSYYPHLGFSDYFLADYVTAIIVAIHLYLMRFVNIAWPKQIVKWIRAGAAMSFTLYLIHLPIVLLIKRNVGTHERTLGLFILTLVCVIGVCTFVSKYTEEKRYVIKSDLKKWLEKRR